MQQGIGLFQCKILLRPGRVFDLTPTVTPFDFDPTS